MGSTTYGWPTTAEQAKRYEIGESTEVLFKAGNWWCCRNEGSDSIYAVYFRVQRYGDGINVRATSMDMGPGEVPSEVFFRRYVKVRPEPYNDWEAQWRERCEETYAAKKAAGSIVRGTQFKLKNELDYGGRYGKHDTFIMHDPKRRIASTMTGYNVRLPVGWQSLLATPEPIGSAP